MKSLPKTGDAVTWSTAKGETRGRVEGIVTREMKVKGHVAKASKDHPQVMVRSDASGRIAVHQPEALKPT